MVLRGVDFYLGPAPLFQKLAGRVCRAILTVSAIPRTRRRRRRGSRMLGGQGAASPCYSQAWSGLT